MKNVILIFNMLISLSGCNDDNTDKQENSIIGTWKLIEVYNAVDNWSLVKEGGYTFTLRSNMSFETDRYKECNVGAFTIVSDTINVMYSCTDFTCTQSNAFCKDVYSFQDGFLLLEPIGCFEGCISKFKRIHGE